MIKYQLLIGIGLTALLPTVHAQQNVATVSAPNTPVTYEVRSGANLTSIIHAEGGIDSTNTLHNVTILNYRTGKATTIIEADTMQVQHQEHNTIWVLHNFQNKTLDGTALIVKGMSMTFTMPDNVMQLHSLGNTSAASP